MTATTSAVASPTLAQLIPGASARITALDGSLPSGVAERLRHLGLLPGTVVALVRKAPFGGPAVYRLRGYELCLRRAQANAVLVEHGTTVEDRA